jgi:hypothetical protein
MEPIQPTVIYDAAAVPDWASLDVSRAHVGIVAGDRPHFTDETATLLRARLSAAASMVTVVLGAAFIGNFIAGVTTLWWLRGMIPLVAAGAVALLRYRPSLSLPQLRAVELVVFGSVVVQLSVRLLTRLSEFAADGDATSLAAVVQQYLMAWCVLIFLYGTLMPNTWQRGAAVMLPAAALPYLLVTLSSPRSGAGSTTWPSCSTSAW